MPLTEENPAVTSNEGGCSMCERETIVVDVYGVLPDGTVTEEFVYMVEGDRETVFHGIDWKAEAALMGYAALQLRNVRAAA